MVCNLCRDQLPVVPNVGVTRPLEDPNVGVTRPLEDAEDAVVDSSEVLPRLLLLVLYSYVRLSKCGFGCTICLPTLVMADSTMALFVERQLGLKKCLVSMVRNALVAVATGCLFIL